MKNRGKNITMRKRRKNYEDSIKTMMQINTDDRWRKTDDGCQVMAKAHIAFGKVS
jgi:hypothetical protein